MIKTSTAKNASRRGIATTEFAVIAPVIVIIFLGATCAMAQISLKRNLHLVALAAATGVSNPSNSLGEIESHYEAFASDLGIQNADLSINVHSGRIYAVQATAPNLGNNPVTAPGSSAEMSVKLYVYR